MRIKCEGLHEKCWAHMPCSINLCYRWLVRYFTVTRGMFDYELSWSQIKQGNYIICKVKPVLRRCPVFPDTWMSYERNFSLERWHPGQHLHKGRHSDSHLLFIMMLLGMDQGLITKTQLRISFAKGHQYNFHGCGTCRYGLLKGAAHRNGWAACAPGSHP